MKNNLPIPQKNQSKPVMYKVVTCVLFTIMLLSGGNASAQNIGINGTGGNAHPSALLDIDAVATPSLGVLIPRIALGAINVAAPVSSPATSLLLYNTATAGTGTNAVSPGFYYWGGTQWMRLVSVNTGTSSSSSSGGGDSHCYTCDGF